MIKLTMIEDGKPIIGLGVEYSDWEALKDKKQTFAFEIGGQTVHVGYIGSKRDLEEKIAKKGLAAKITAAPDGQVKSGFEEKIQIVPGKLKEDQAPTS